jgi:DNA-binding response OmpR family regulator
MTKEVISYGKTIALSRNEIQAIEFLIEKRGQLVHYGYFASIIGDEVSEIAIKNIISRLRKKINCPSIKNIAKIGYILS